MRTPCDKITEYLSQKGYEGRELDQAAFHATAQIEAARTNPTYETVAPKLGESGRWEVPDPEVPRMVCLFDTEAEAAAFHSNALARIRNREQMQARIREEERERAEREARHLAKFDGFLSSDPMHAGRERRALERQVVYKRLLVTWLDLVRAKVSEGATLSEDGLTNPDGSFLVVGSIVRRFAAYLISKR